MYLVYGFEDNDAPVIGICETVSDVRNVIERYWKWSERFHRIKSILISDFESYNDRDIIDVVVNVFFENFGKGEAHHLVQKIYLNEFIIPS